MSPSTSVDLRSKMPPIIDQGSLGSCTACALASLYSYLKPTLDPSILFVYYNVRYLDSLLRGGNNPSIDDGSTLYQGINSLVKYGVCSSSLWPYILNKQGIKPTANCYTDALNNQTLQFLNVPQTLIGMKNALIAGYPFVVGIAVYQSFISTNAIQTGMIPMPSSRDRLLGYHAISVVGFKDSNQRFICRNSWGTSFGDKGYMYIPYNYFTNRRLASDLWCIKLIE